MFISSYRDAKRQRRVILRQVLFAVTALSLCAVYVEVAITAFAR